MDDPLPPLTDEALDEIERQMNLVWHDMPIKMVLDYIADARWHRAELAKARAENEKLRVLFGDLERQIDALREMLGDPDNTFDGFHHAVNSLLGRIAEARAAIAPEGKKGG